MSPFTIKNISLGIVLAACMLSGSAWAEKGYYKWFDSRGNPQHSDRPPPAGVEYEFVSTDTGMRRRVTAEEAAKQGDDDGDAAASMPSNTTATPNVAEQQAAVKKDPALCEQAKANLETLNSKARVRIRDDDGIRYLTEEEKDVQRKKAEDLIAVHCGS